ncbi:actin-related protein 6 [Tribolium castaneum]|uniref:actin-related protein 6 n=1 Tax=Tribolium castaneum TaxID=7070 RepID=UPI0000D569B3|nr:PREDICTED: actin-related protein 6 [Tribolium castaneum]|eukprot:XP_975041.1 PREDICTED: actin-related protein 6 [Tribolium castaneum]
MSHMDSSLSDEDLDEGQSEVKRIRYDSKIYNVSRRFEKHQRPRRTRLASRDSHSFHVKESNLQGLIFDNGAHTIKINYSFEEEPKIIPNCIMKAKSERKRLFIGSQIDECRDCSGLFYLIPSERGYITKWDVQKPIWDFVLSKNVCPVNNYPVIMTQPLFNFKSIQDCIDEIFFEEYEVSSMFRLNPTDLAVLQYHKEIGAKPPCIIVDSGYSFTHVIPYLEGKKYLKGVRRINVGGKLLTNHLKDIISYRQYHVMEETFVINQVKEDTCYVSQDFKSDLKAAELPPSKNHIIRNYVLPDFNNIRRGYIQDRDQKDEIAENCQILRLNNERFTVPEILFHPSDIGIKSIGIAEAVCKSIFSCPLSFQKDLAKNIVCIGGSTKFDGFRDRLFNEVRSMIPASWEVNVYQPSDPITYNWMGGKVLLKDPEFKSKLVTKQEYEECGMSAIQEKFNQWSIIDIEETVQSKPKIEPVSYIDHLKKYDVFGKGIVSEESSENNEKKNENPEESRKCEEEIDVSSKNDGEEKLNLTDDDKFKVVKMIKKSTRSGTAPMIYSVKIVSSVSKAN